MKRSLLSMSSLLIIASAAVVQPRISSNKEAHSFGQIERKHPVTVEYTITNTGNQSLVLTNVTTSCACTAAGWTKEPIAPGGKGVVRVSFDAKALGHFEGSIGIHNNASPSSVYLKFTGEVAQEIKDYTKLLPYTTGNTRLDCDEFAFPDAYCKQQPSLAFGIANLSGRLCEPVLMYLSPYLKMEVESKVSLKGKKGTIKLTLDASQLKDYGLTQTSICLSRFSGDKVNEDNEIPVLAILLLDFSRMTEKDSLNAPVTHISETDIDLNAPLAKKNEASHDILIANSGKTPLVISRLQVSNSSVGVSLKKTVLPLDGMTKLKVTTRKRDVGNKEHYLRILVTTNDPPRPKVEINIKRQILRLWNIPRIVKNIRGSLSIKALSNPHL